MVIVSKRNVMGMRGGAVRCVSYWALVGSGAQEAEEAGSSAQ